MTNGRIKKIKNPYNKPGVNKLVGMNIFKITKTYPEFKELQEDMKFYCERADH